MLDALVIGDSRIVLGTSICFWNGEGPFNAKDLAFQKFEGIHDLTSFNINYQFLFGGMRF